MEPITEPPMEAAERVESRQTSVISGLGCERCTSAPMPTSTKIPEDRTSTASGTKLKPTTKKDRIDFEKAPKTRRQCTKNFAKRLDVRAACLTIRLGSHVVLAASASAKLVPLLARSILISQPLAPKSL